MRILLLLLLAATAQAHEFAPKIVDARESSPEVVREGNSFRLVGSSEVVLRAGNNIVLLTPQSPTWTIKETPPPTDYLRLGVEHILGGFDHLLFVLGLFLLVRRKLLWTLSAFTLAHSFSLGLAALGVISVPQAPVEAAIALSILCIAVELLREGPSLTKEKPWLVAFAFGLIHGLGFAGALGEIGLPQGQLVPALVCFNVGVELGQLAFVAALLLFSRLLHRRVMAYAIGAISVYFCLDRVAGFWS
jgi:hypothetical protein